MFPTRQLCWTAAMTYNCLEIKYEPSQNTAKIAAHTMDRKKNFAKLISGGLIRQVTMNDKIALTVKVTYSGIQLLSASASKDVMTSQIKKSRSLGLSLRTS
jgi:hypothetical protein